VQTQKRRKRRGKSEEEQEDEVLLFPPLLPELRRQSTAPEVRAMSNRSREEEAERGCHEAES
jgi:hypothetical protein